MLHLNRMRHYCLEVITFVSGSLKYFVLNIMKGYVYRLAWKWISDWHFQVHVLTFLCKGMWWLLMLMEYWSKSKGQTKLLEKTFGVASCCEDNVVEIKLLKYKKGLSKHGFLFFAVGNCSLLMLPEKHNLQASPPPVFSEHQVFLALVWNSFIMPKIVLVPCFLVWVILAL